MDLSQLGINTSSDVTIPGLENLQSTINTITLISIVLGGLFFIVYMINVIHRMRADHAMIAMHKDVTAIRALLEQQHAPAAAPSAVAPITPPASAVPMVAPITRGESESASTT